MLVGAGLSRCWPHDRAHQFFSRVRWNSDDLGLAAAKLVVALLAPTGQPVTIAIDDTLFRRRGKNVGAAGWFHDGSAPGPATTGYGNNWVIGAIVVKLPIVKRTVALPVLAKLVIKVTNSASRLWLACRMAGRCPGAASTWWPTLPTPGKSSRSSPPALPGPPGCARTPPCTNCRRPAPAGGAGPAPEASGYPPWTCSPASGLRPVTVTRYGKTATIHAEAIT
jgi:hypothetical protein